MRDDNVISIFKPTKKEIARLEAKFAHLLPKPPVKSHLELDPGFRDESDRYPGKLGEALRKYGSFKGYFRSKK
jgi:hypothetical protein